MKTSVILTTYNEQENITDLLHALVNQSLKPDEIVIVDAKSTDHTRELIIAFASKSPIPITLLNQLLNRSEARNRAIKEARGRVIAVTDAGCRPLLDWLERITKPILEGECDSVAGYYMPLVRSNLQHAMAPFLAVMPDRFNPSTYLPSSRSVAFTKDAWNKAGRYPVHLNYCEDLVFASQLKQQTQMVVERKALVKWIIPQTIGEFFHKIKNYAKGDVEARYLPHLHKIKRVYVRYVILILLPVLFFPYLLWPIYKHRNYMKNIHVVIYTALLQIVIDLAILVGSFQGLTSKNN